MLLVYDSWAPFVQWRGGAGWGGEEAMLGRPREKRGRDGGHSRKARFCACACVQACVCRMR